MKGIAILGSTGSIGQSALAVVDAHPQELRVVGLAAGGNAARLRGAGREATGRRASALAADSGPDCLIDDRDASRRGRRAVRLVRDGRARRRPRGDRGGQDDRAREQGDPRDGRLGGDGGGEAPRRRRAAGRQRAQRDSSVPARPPAVGGQAADPDGLRRSVPRHRGARSWRRSSAADALQSSDLAHGTEDHDRLRDADEQGARGDRGALAVRRRPPIASTCSSTRSRSSIRWWNSSTDP